MFFLQFIYNELMIPPSRLGLHSFNPSDANDIVINIKNRQQGGKK